MFIYATADVPQPKTYLLSKEAPPSVGADGPEDIFTTFGLAKTKKALYSFFLNSVSKFKRVSNKVMVKNRGYYFL